jgi:tetratricopeptide (TPR) repeat protein
MCPSFQLDSAIEDYEKAINIFTRLVDQEGRRELAYYLVSNLRSLSWLYATCHDGSFRNAEKAVKYATKACKLSNWEDWASINALAASYARTADFESATKWQSKAVEIAPAQAKEWLRSLLQLYQSGMPYREPPPALE